MTSFFSYWRQFRRQAQRLQMKLSGPSLGVIEMFIFFVFNFIKSCFQNFPLIAGESLNGYADQFPVQVVFAFRLDNAFGRHDLRSRRSGCRRSHFDCFHQRLAGEPDDVSAGCVLVWIQPELLQNIDEDLAWF